MEKRKLKFKYLSHTRHLVLKICETIQTDIWSNYWNTRILFGVPKNPNTKYQILFGIEKIRIPVSCQLASVKMSSMTKFNNDQRIISFDNFRVAHLEFFNKSFVYYKIYWHLFITRYLDTFAYKKCWLSRSMRWQAPIPEQIPRVSSFL